MRESDDIEAGAAPVSPLAPGSSRQAMRDHYQSIVQSSDDAIVAKTLDGIVTSWNPAAERMFGYTEQEMLGKPMQMLLRWSISRPCAFAKTADRLPCR